MNNIVNTQQVTLPAHLQHLGLAAKTPSAIMAGITSGASIHQISIKSSRWRLQDPQGQEIVVPQHYLDVIVVDANPNVSKVYYAGQYNPADTEIKAPDCWSDNGVAPAARAQNKQAAACAQCPHNVWGSRVTPNGSQTKACADSKKLAVILAENPTGPVYMLKIPPASLKNLFAYAEDCLNRGVDTSLIVTRLEFDTQADFPKVKFSATGWISPEQAAVLQKLVGSDEVKTVIGLKETPVAASAQFTNVVRAAPQYISMFNDTQPVTQPVTPSSAVQQAAAEPKKRTKKATPAAETVAPPAPPAPAQGGFFSNLQQKTAPATGVGAVASVVVNPQPTTSSLDDLIAQAMKA